MTPRPRVRTRIAPVHMQPSSALQMEESEITQNGGRLDIRASVDLEGLRKLRGKLELYEKLLELEAGAQKKGEASCE